MSWREEHPTITDMPDLPPGWEDTSWHNDTCPSYRKGRTMVFIDYPDPADRELDTGHRFSAYALDEEGCMYFTGDGSGEDDLLHTDSWDEVLRLFAERED